jgi:hypothetical protein
MPEMIGTITNIKLGSFLQDSVNAFDIGTVTLHETATGANWVLYLWISRADAPALQRVLQTQRLALAREAAFRHKVVHVWHEIDSSLVDEIQVDIG